MNQSFKKQLTLLLSTACLFLSTLLVAGPIKKILESDTRDPLYVGISPTGLPICAKVRNQLTGIEVDLAQAFGQALDRPVEFIELKFEDLIPNLRAKKIDIIMSGFSITRLRSMQINFSEPYMTIGQKPMVRREDAGKYSSAVDVITMSGKVGVEAHTTGEFLVVQDFSNAQKEFFKTVEQAEKALEKGKIDMFIVDSSVADFHAAQNEKLTALPYLLSEEKIAWGINKDNEKLLSLANQFLGTIQQTGELNKILDKYLPRAE